jgi:hypothetical protein
MAMTKSALELLLLIAVFSLAACGPNDGSGDAKRSVSSTSGGEPVLYDHREDYPEKARPFIKIPPYEDAAVDQARDAASCRAAGGDWGDVYELGTLSSPNTFSDADWGSTPEEERKSVGKRCWSRPVVYADGGKSCNDQSECLMNCIAARTPEGRFEPPQCQGSNWEQPNCEAIVVRGVLIDVYCSVP